MARSNRLLFALGASEMMIALTAGEMPLEECRRGAAQGDVEATYQLGIRYENGDGVRQDGLRALANFRKAAEKGHVEACRKVADIYESGRGVSKNAVLAAKYRAMAVGQNGETAAASAKGRVEREGVDEIEVALDYIIGRNGKVRDAETGIRLLYDAAKDKPVAQRVFVQRWTNGEFDDAVGMLDESEWSLIAPWFAKAFEDGVKSAGQILGIDSFCKATEEDRTVLMKSEYLPKIGFNEFKRVLMAHNSLEEACAQYYYHRAIYFWRESRRAKCLLWIGQFYDPSITKKDSAFSGPPAMKDERKAMAAYESSIRIDNKLLEARLSLVILCVQSKDRANRVANQNKALEHLRILMASDKLSARYNFWYGVLGYDIVMDKYEQRKVRYYNGAGQLVNPAGYRNLVSQINRELEGYLKYIRLASATGYELATDFLRQNRLLR